MEKKLTDEEIVKALDVCKTDGIDNYKVCENCPCIDLHPFTCVHKLKGYALDLINRQKAEIERLTEENFVLYRDRFTKKELDDIADCRVKNATAELQKQVDELKKTISIKEGYIDRVESEVVEWQFATKKAVKDTAKEILDEIGDSDILIVQTQEYGEIEVVPMERLKEIIKSKGVEVE